MNAEIRTEAAQFLFGEYINRIFFSVYAKWGLICDVFRPAEVWGGWGVPEGGEGGGHQDCLPCQEFSSPFLLQVSSLGILIHCRKCKAEFRPMEPSVEWSCKGRNTPEILFHIICLNCSEDVKNWKNLPGCELTHSSTHTSCADLYSTHWRAIFSSGLQS